jgi:hypothetical protein
MAVDEQGSLVSTSGIITGGKHRSWGMQIVVLLWRILMIPAVLQKKILSKLFQQTPMTRSDVVQIRTDIEQLRANIFSRIERIPKSPAPLGGDVACTQGKYNSNPTLNRWCRLSLSAFFDQFWSLLYMPLFHTNISAVWSNLRQRYDAIILQTYELHRTLQVAKTVIASPSTATTILRRSYIWS